MRDSFDRPGSNSSWLCSANASEITIGQTVHGVLSACANAVIQNYDVPVSANKTYRFEAGGRRQRSGRWRGKRRRQFTDVL